MFILTMMFEFYQNLRESELCSIMKFVKQKTDKHIRKQNTTEVKVQGIRTAVYSLNKSRTAISR